MDGRRFDALLQRWTTQLTRRAATAQVVGGAVGAAFALPRRAAATPATSAALASTHCSTGGAQCGFGHPPCCADYYCDSFQFCTHCKGPGDFCGGSQGYCCAGLSCHYTIPGSYGTCVTTAAATDQDPSEENAEREHTGAVRLLVTGLPPTPPSAASILEIADAATFAEEAALEESFGAEGSIVHVPRALEPTAAHEALLRGLLVARITVEGSPPAGSLVAAGTYYLWIDFIDGQWVGRYVSATEPAAVAAAIPGIQVKEEANFAPHVAAAHSTPWVAIHPLGEGLGPEERPLLWSHYGGGWRDYGTGCHSITVCVPH